ncbi:MAG: molybdate ABC transporter substrate-binding protein, partial [Desulfobacterales bacterium]|nr:molybdate ABC transporter substrate-binding protein [Desulfobacterales bacterium]
MAKQIRKEARTKSTSWKLYGLSVMMMVWMGAGIFPFSPVASASETELVVFAAASTTNAVTEVGEKFAVRNPGHIKTSFASSSTLAKQIANGAPVDVYISANKKWMDFLEEKNLLAQGSRFDLLSNRIVLIVPDDSRLEPV